ncbi:hypothetical protein [Actibacterium lipolyticum]|uniref:Uncharacterized protein n=1 Tax=Actibacterium lipolyticum TaxID=1524263 RepID=A0A238KT44_9RHOB|nr:hypothetical protein [Actibacterium lipolyticum]SMX45993.1 hypothetical protein COL8621_02942 [Actibacterium lipolyticum]
MHQSEHSISVGIADIGGVSLKWAQTLMSDLACDPHLAAAIADHSDPLVAPFNEGETIV